MKKVLAVFTAVSLLFLMCIPAFAGENVDALEDEKQSEIAALVLSAVEEGGDVDTIAGRSQIGQQVVSGISDLTPYKEAYEADETSLKPIVAAAVEAVRQDVGFSASSANMLVSEITKDLKDKFAPEQTEPTTEPTTEPEEPLNNNIGTIYSLLSNLPFDQLKSVLLSLLGNGVINKTDAKYIIDKLLREGKINADQAKEMTDALSSEEASTGILDKIFNGYTPTDLSQLFRGFGDAIQTMATALANLLRTDSDENPSDNTNPDETPADIPATGDYAFPAVCTVAVLAGAVFVLTRKKTEE